MVSPPKTPPRRRGGPAVSGGAEFQRALYAAQVILMWGIIAVYFIEPVNRELVLEMSSGEECDRSCKAWASVWSSAPWRKGVGLGMRVWGLGPIGFGGLKGFERV